jgi:hypothetical protein
MQGYNCPNTHAMPRYEATEKIIHVYTDPQPSTILIFPSHLYHYNSDFPPSSNGLRPFAKMTVLHIFLKRGIKVSAVLQSASVWDLHAPGADSRFRNFQIRLLLHSPHIHIHKTCFSQELLHSLDRKLRYHDIITTLPNTRRMRPIGH